MHTYLYLHVHVYCTLCLAFHVCVGVPGADARAEQNGSLSHY